MQSFTSQDAPDREREGELGSSFRAHLLDALPLAITYLDRDLVYRYCNTAAARLIGRPVEQIVGHHLHEIVPDNLAGWNDMERMLRTGEAFEETISFAWADRPGHGERQYRVTCQADRDETGQIVGVLSRGEDITDPICANEELNVEIAECQQAEAVVETERNRLQSVLELLPAYVVLLSPDHHVPFANRFFRERFGESHGQRCFEYLFGRSEPCEICESYKVLETQSSHHWEWTGPDGRNYDIFDFPFADADGSPLILEMGIDITERKLAEKALQKAYDLLEARAQERTVELTRANEILQEQAEELQRQREELEVQTEELHQQTDELLISGQELRETRDYLDNLLTYANAPIIVWDPDFRITRFNSAFERLTGYKSEEVLGQPLDLLFPEDRKAEAMGHIRRALAGERWEVVEIPIQRVDGTVRTVLWNSATLYAADGTTAMATIAQGQDITERKQVEQELREARDYLDNLLTYANAPIIVWDPDFRITRFNGAFERLTGRKSQAVVGQPLDLLFPKERREAAMVHIRRALVGERWEVVEIPIQRVDGMVRTVLWNSATLYATDGITVVATIAQGQDITERKQAEQELRETRDYLDNLLTYANAPIIVWDPDFHITRFNGAFEWLTGHRSEEVLGRPLDLLFPAERKEEAMEHIRRTTTGERWEVVEIPIQRVDGTVRTVLWNSATLYATDGTTVVATIAQGQDITERKQAEEERERLLLQVERERERVEKLATEAEQRANELGAVFSALTEGVVVFDGEGRVVQTNPAEVAMMGGSSFPADRQGEVEQFLCRRKKDGPVISAAELPSSRALTGETVISEHMVLTTADRRDLTILSSAAPLQWGGRIVGAVATHYDVTELEQARALSELLNRVNAQIISSPDVETAIQQATGEMVEILGMEVGGFIRREEDHWVLWHVEGLSNDLVERPFVDEETDVVTWIAEHQDVLVIDDLALVPQFKLPIARSYGFRSLVVVPLWLKDQLIGALMLGRRSTPVRFTHDQVDFGRKLSRLLSLALENAHLYKLARQDAETKAVLLREVNHRVKNNLSAIAGLLYGQMDRPGASAQPEYQAALRELIDRIQGLSVVHGMLSQSQWAPLRLNELAKRIIGVTLQSAPAGKVSVTISPSPVYVSPDQAHTLALVLNELALNVGKHALQGRSCQVILNAVQEESHVLLTVRDDGPGYPAEVLAKHRSGIGLELLRNLVTRNLRGQLSLRNEAGAVTEIRFPLAGTDKGTDRN